MSGFCGTKFRPTGRTYQATDRDGNSVIRDEFAPTAAYMKWLAAERERKQQEELALMRAKLQYQFETYGEVDELDYNLYLYKLKLYGTK